MEEHSKTMLVIDDDIGDVEILRRAAQQLPGCPPELVYFVDPESALLELQQRVVDVILLDYQLGGVTGLTVLRTLRASGDQRPVIILTGRNDATMAAELLRDGADDYLVKSDLNTETLRRAIDNACAQAFRRRVEGQNRLLIEQLGIAKASLEAKNKRLGEMYEMAYRFVADVSHDFRTPLTVIKEFASILTDGLGGKLTAEQREYVGYISDRADDLTLMVNDLLDLSRHDAGLLRAVRRYCSMAEVSARALGSLTREADAAGITLEVEVPADLPRAYCDAEKIGRVVINLTANALKFTPAGGRIRIWAAENDDSCTVRFCVTDNGPGIAAEDQARLFSRYRQIERDQNATRKGCGLGLSIARELVRLNLGEIGIESQIGKGSTFWFTLPSGTPVEIAASYLNRLEREDSETVSVVLLLARTNSELAGTEADDFDEFLQRVLRNKDLLLRVAPDSQLLLVALGEEDVPALTARITAARQEANRNRPANPLPSIEIELVRVWRKGDSVQPIITDVARMCRSPEAVGV